jgi:hypothetical protein
MPSHYNTLGNFGAVNPLAVKPFELPTTNSLLDFGGAGTAQSSFGDNAGLTPLDIGGAIDPLSGTGPEGGFDFGNMANFGKLLQGLSSGVGAFTGLKQLGLAKKQFNFTKDFAEKNFDLALADHERNLATEKKFSDLREASNTSGVTAAQLSRLGG